METAAQRTEIVAERSLKEIVTQSVFSRSQIAEKSRYIHDRLLSESHYLAQPNFRAIHPDDLENLFEYYDELFFDGACRREVSQDDTNLSFRLSKRMTSSGGTTTRRRYRVGKAKTRTDFQISVATTLLFETFGSIDRPISVAGHTCQNRLEALQRIFEHEMIHLIEMLVWGDSSCSQKRFQLIADRVFAHSDVVHQLITPKEKAHVAFGLQAGDLVSFDMDGVKYRGTIRRITKRATVLVKDRGGQLYSDGQRYAKYYVPLSQLRPAG